jgi:hypothetical protein
MLQTRTPTNNVIHPERKLVMMKTKTVAAVVAIGLLASACAGSQGRPIASAHKTQAQMDHDSASCKRQAGGDDGSWAFGPLFIILPIMAIQVVARSETERQYLECLKIKGYAISKTG